MESVANIRYYNRSVCSNALYVFDDLWTLRHRKTKELTDRAVPVFESGIYRCDLCDRSVDYEYKPDEKPELQAGTAISAFADYCNPVCDDPDFRVWWQSFVF